MSRMRSSLLRRSAMHVSFAGGKSCSLGVEDSIALSGFRSLERAFAESLPDVQLRETSNFIVGLRGCEGCGRDCSYEGGASHH